MHVMIDLCVVPLGVGVSVGAYVSACQEVIEQAGLEHQMHAYGTNIEGEWDAVFEVVKRCHEVVHDMGAPRITTSMRIGTRTDREQSMTDKIESVQRLRQGREKGISGSEGSA
ncbi:hypothetical protein GCM10010082_07540 [Kushneria pakistanensis]|uniref:Thiamine-binding protein domain-containing protein n=1 Tax=Kushneria pakistanensis TaxID=1508770 RepID=A0ABQ3FCU8_9GAMM|nr:MTH1187 family thiamine-binding protein [Kushneria pakistanensis]GHC18617.1 hypothetical protein GCM10010082_07540 [Kushneria pakistanensis]